MEGNGPYIAQVTIAPGCVFLSRSALRLSPFFVFESSLLRRSISDDAQPGNVTPFPQAVQLRDGEVIALPWVVYRNKEDRDRINKAVMDDPQLKDSMNPWKMPFDGKRMFWGGFETIVGLSAGR